MDTMNTEYATAYIDIINGNGQTKTIFSDSSEGAIDSIVIRTGCYDGNAVGVGSVYEAQCSIVMEETEGVTAGIELGIAYNIGGKGWERFGTFYVSQTPEYSGGKMTVEAHGEISISGGKTYTNQDFYRPDKITTVGYILDSLMEYGITVNYDKTSAFASWQIAAPGYDDDSQENKWKSERIYVKEVLAGIAIMYGGNMVERNGTIYLTPKNGGEGGNFSVDDCTSYQCSRESYGIESIALSSLPWVEMKITDMDNPGQILERFILYQGTERETRNILVSQADTGANIRYQQQIECDWIGYSMSYAGGCFVQGDLVYKTGTFTFPGFNEKLYAGNVINIYLDENKFIPFVIGEMTLNWDGGFTTEISCSCSVDTVTGICESSTSSTAVATGNSANALLNYNSSTFSYVDFSNALEHSLPGFILKEKTIEGWAIKDGTITGSNFADGSITNSKIADSTITDSKIEDSTITGSKIAYSTIEGSNIKGGTITESLIADATLTGAKIKDATIGFEKVDTSFITKLTANDAYIQKLSASVANIQTLTASDGIIKNIFSNQIISDEAVIDVLKSNIIDAEYIKAVVADVGALTADAADIRYANIDFSNVKTESVGKLYADSGILTEVTITDGNVTGRLNGVKINADVIDAGTLSTDRLLVTGEDGIVYQINVNSSGLSMSELEDPKYQKYLNGTDIVANSVTATQMAAHTLTANEINAKSIAGAVGEFIEINAGQITSGKISSDLIYADSILAQKIMIGGELVTVKATDSSTMVSGISGLGGTVISNGYVVNSNSSYKNIVPLCGFTKNKFSVGDAIKAKATVKISSTTSDAGLKAFIWFFSGNKDGTVNNNSTFAAKLESESIHISSSEDAMVEFELKITSNEIPYQFKDGTTENSYFIIGIKHEYIGSTVSVKSASFISGIPGLTVNGDILVNDGELRAKTIRGTVRGDVYCEYLKNTGLSYFQDAVNCNSTGRSVGGNNLGVYLATTGIVGIVSQSGKQLRLESNNIQCLSGELTIQAGTNVVVPSTLKCTGGIVANAYTSTGSMELYHPEGTPYIDFHHGAYGTETTDFTSRIIEYAPGALTFECGLAMSGVIVTAASKYTDDGTTGALNLRNSNIVGVNGIYTADLAEEASEGINFYRTSSSVDSVFANGGKLYFAPGRSLGTVVYPSGSYKIQGRKYGTMTAVNGRLSSESFVWVDNDNHGQLHAVLTNVTVSAAYTWTALLNPSVYPSRITHGQVQVTDGGAGVSGTERAATRMQSNVAITSPVTFSGKQVIIDIFW